MDSHDLDVASCLQRWSRRDGEKTALIMLGDGERETHRISYAELTRRAGAVAACLADRFAPGAAVMLLFPSHPAFAAAFYACLMAGMVAVPAPYNNRRQAMARTLSIAANARPAAVLTLDAIRADLGSALCEAGALAAVPWLAMEEIGPTAREYLDPADPSAPALLQYTSGSTSEPKGVVVTHGNLFHNLRQMAAALDTDRHSCFVSWAPLFHDMGLIAMLLQALFVGAKIVMMPPTAFLQKPSRWIEAISRYRGTISAAPNFAFDLCCDRIGAARLLEFDLSCWKMALCAAEPIRAATLERFARHFASAGFQPQALAPGYGLAEATVFATATPPGAGVHKIAVDADCFAAGRIVPPSARAAHLVSCGRPAPDTEIMIVDPVSADPLSEGEIGEILVCGPQVSDRYWNAKPGENQVFHARVAGRDAPEDRFLRTGDLGFLREGDLFVTGRIKDLIIIRGTNIHPHDIEMTVAASHPAFAADRGSAFSVILDGLEELVVAHELDRHHLRAIPAKAMTEAAVEAVTRQFGVRLHDLVLLAPNTLPRTTSGKIRRHQCHDDYLENRLVRACPPIDSPGLGRCRPARISARDGGMGG
jgi:nonribosomal peptide synthetase protein BlmVI